MRCIILLAGLSAIMPAIVQAQGRGAMPVMTHVPVPMMTHAPVVAPHAVVRGVAPATVRVAGSGRVLQRNGARIRSSGGVVRVTRPPVVRRVPPINNVNLEDVEEFSEDFVPVPGLGFDIPHLAATQGGRAVGARHRHGFGFGMSFPLFGGAIFVPVSSAVEEEEAPATQAQEEVAETEPVRPVRRERVQEAPTPRAVEAAPAAQRETEEYVFVRRNGTLFFAVAYAWESGGTLRYVTREGLRRSISGEALDLGATQQFNEQRGLNFHLPA